MLPLRSVDSRFPIPDWNAVYADPTLPAKSVAERDAFWTERGREWVGLLRDSFGSEYVSYESAHFWLVSREPAATCTQLVQWAEAARARVLRFLAIDPSAHLSGKIPILMLHDEDTYYDYYAGYLEKGTYAASGGVYLNHGYGHFVFAFRNLSQAEPVLVHELTHAMVCHLPLPRWLNEGIAQLCEQAITGRVPTSDPEILETLESFWTETTIQAFWDGRSFNRTHLGQLHSYHLASVLTRKLIGGGPRFASFLKSASEADAGAAALREHFAMSLSELAADYLGEGNWSHRHQRLLSGRNYQF